jgi:multimeric flavodoxin WrbA
MNESRPVHIVALNGSPHKGGNTATLMGWVLEGYREAGAEAEWLHIGDYDLRSCQGCLACLRTGDCVLEDDYRLLRGKLLAADGIVIGAPSYEGQPPARLKVFLERLMLLNLYTLMFSRQYVMGVATSGLSWCDDLAESLTTGLGWHSGTISARTSTLAHGYRPLAEAHPKRLLAQARALGRRLVANIRTPSWARHLQPGYLVFRLMHRFLLRRMVTQNPEQFAGVLRVWREQGRM